MATNETTMLPQPLFSLSSQLIVIVIVNVISRYQKRYSKAKRTKAPAYSRALRRLKGGSSSGPISRMPGRDSVHVAVTVGVVQIGRVNDAY